MPPPKPASTLGRGVILPLALACAALGVLGLFLSTFLRDTATLALGLGAAWVSFGAGRVLAHLDRPRGYGRFARHLLTGLAFGFAGFAFVRGLFVEGPAHWLLVGGFGFGLYRAHRALLKDARENGDGSADSPSQAAGLHAPRWLGLFHPKDVQALVVLLAGYAIFGVACFMTLRAIVGFIPNGGQILAVAGAAYALHGARLLLGFAAEDRATASGGFVGWLKANALQNGIVLLLFIAYAVFRARLAVAIPFFALVEFGLGVAVFAFVLARLRSKLRKDGTLLATASDARDHERIVSELRDADYDLIARPVTRFIESGLGKDEYARAVLVSIPSEDARAQQIHAQVLAHREPPRPPALELNWAFAAGGALTLGLGIAAFALAFILLDAPLPYPFYLALLLVAFGAYAQQDVARAHHRPWLALAIAGGGTAILLLDFLLFVGEIASLASVPGIVWVVVLTIGVLMLGIPGYSAWKQDRRLRAGEVADTAAQRVVDVLASTSNARRLAPALELTHEIQRARKNAATTAVLAFAILLPAPWLAGWLASRGLIPSGFLDFFDNVLSVAIFVVAAFGAAALVRFYGLTSGRPQLLAREKAKRDRRLTLHRSVMQSIERT